MKRVAIIHPWLPQYRVPFFEELKILCDGAGIELDVFYGAPPPEWKGRNDSATSSTASLLPTRFIPFLGRHFIYKSLKPLGRLSDYDLIIVEQAIRNLESYALLIRARKRIAFWGHGKSYSGKKNFLEEMLKTSITNLGSWFFGYTSDGVEAVVARGFDAARITAVQNSIDTRALAGYLSEVTEDELNRFKSSHSLTDSTALFIGGVDRAKRIDFLIAAARYAHTLDPAFRLLVAGDGNDRDMITSVANQEPWLKFLGPVRGKEKALALKSARAIAIPGAVGLVAVDSLVSGVPIVTTTNAEHGPEFDYLSPGHNSMIVADRPEVYARALLQIVSDGKNAKVFSLNCLAERSKYSISRMCNNFFEGIVSALEMTRKNS